MIRFGIAHAFAVAACCLGLLSPNSNSITAQESKKDEALRRSKEVQRQIDEINEKLFKINTELQQLALKDDEGAPVKNVEKIAQRRATLVEERQQLMTALGLALASGSTPGSRQDNLVVLGLLKQPIRTRDFSEKIKFKHVLESIADEFAGKVVIVINRDGFAAELGADAPDLYEEEVALPPVPARMPLHVALRLLLGQVGKGRTTYVIRQGHIEIVPLRFTTTGHLLQEPMITAAFDRRAANEVLQTLTDETGMAIHIDPQVSKKLETPISATFRNGTLEEALVTITEMVELKYVALERSVYVTTPDRAVIMQKEEKERETQRKLVREREAGPPQ